jgi:hypothetical protein
VEENEGQYGVGSCSFSFDAGHLVLVVHDVRGVQRQEARLLRHRLQRVQKGVHGDLGRGCRRVLQKSVASARRVKVEGRQEETEAGVVADLRAAARPWRW